MAQHKKRDDDLKFCKFMGKILGMCETSETKTKYSSTVYAFRKKKRDGFSVSMVYYFKDLVANNNVLGFQELCNEFSKYK